MNEKIIWDFLYSKLKNTYGTAGLMGNLFAESSLNPQLANGIKKRGMTNETYTMAVDAGKNNNFINDGIAYGLAQWCYHTRKKALLDKARAENKSVGDINVQLEYLWDEIQKYKTVVNVLYSAKSVKEASDIVLTKYERPANQSDTVKNKRASYGEKYLKMFKDQQPQIKLSIKVAREIKYKLERTT